MKTEKKNPGDREDSEHYLGEGAKGLSGLKEFIVNANQPFRAGVKF